MNKFFGKLKKVKWVSHINLDEDVDFHYPKLIEQFEDLLEVFKACSRTAKRSGNGDDSFLSKDEFINESDGFGEKTIRDWLVGMDDASGLVEKSKIFASFLTVVRKFNYTCVYIFHIICLEKSIWRTIRFHTNIFNIFPAHVTKILESVCIKNLESIFRNWRFGLADSLLN